MGLTLMLRLRLRLRLMLMLMLMLRLTLTLMLRLRLRLRLMLMLMLMLTLTLTLTLTLMLMLMLTLTLRQPQRAIHGLRWLKIYMALTTTMLCENMSSVRLTLMLSQLRLCKTTVYTEASEDDGFSKKINESKLPDEHCKAGKTINQMPMAINSIQF